MSRLQKRRQVLVDVTNYALDFCECGLVRGDVNRQQLTGKRLTTNLKSFDEYLRDAERAHGHLSAGEVLGVPMTMLGLQRLGIEDPCGNNRKCLVILWKSIVAQRMR